MLRFAKSAAIQSPPERPRERHIPLGKAELLAAIAAELKLSEDERREFEQLRRLLDALIHHDFHERMERLKDTYAPFDPDHETKRGDFSQSALEAADVFDQLVRLVDQANYRRLDRVAIDEALQAASDWGIHLHVDLDAFEQLEVFTRGDHVDHRERRTWRRGFRRETVEVPIYRRLVVIVRRKAAKENIAGKEDIQQRPIYLKLFKNIPQMDIDMLLPDTRVRMTWIDQGKIILPTLSGLTLAISKVVMKGLVIFTIAGTRGLLAFLGLVGGTLGYGLKSFFGYLHTKDKYHLNLTRSLYYQNLDNNAGVIFRILDEAELQEFAETLLAYAILWRCDRPEGLTPDELDRRAETLLLRTVQDDVDFDLHDALRKLLAFGLVRRAGNRLVAVPMNEAARELDEQWDNLFPRLSSLKPPAET
ncbi:MAG: TMEM143 family protein [Pirellulaceae bacterium]